MAMFKHRQHDIGIGNGFMLIVCTMNIVDVQLSREMPIIKEHHFLPFSCYVLICRVSSNATDS